VPDEQRAIGESLSEPQPVRADKDSAHAVGERRNDVALEVAADEQHLFGRCFGSGEDEPAEDRAGFADPEWAGEQGDAEQVVDPGFLEGWPAGLVRLGVAGTLPRSTPVAADFEILCSERSQGSSDEPYAGERPTSRAGITRLA
jgi:hypothetical protein